MFVNNKHYYFTNNMIKNEIIHTAIELLKKVTGLNAGYYKPKKKHFDGHIKIKTRKERYYWDIIIKETVTHNNIAQIQRMITQKNINVNILLAAGRIYPKIRTQLKNLNIAYLDTTGNMFLKQGGLHIQIEGNEKPDEKAMIRNRAFTNAGLKVLFYLLYEPANINNTIREIAHKTVTALDTVHKTIHALAQMKHILKVNKKAKRLVNTRVLLDRWIQDYEIKLKAKMYIGTFRFINKDHQQKWKDISLKTGETFWGGEAAGALMTNYLNPEVFTLYTTEYKNELIKKYDIYPDKNGNIKVYRKFWNFKHQGETTVPALLVYTDLVNTGDERCIETANIIYNELPGDRYK